MTDYQCLFFAILQTPGNTASICRLSVLVFRCVDLCIFDKQSYNQALSYHVSQIQQQHHKYSCEIVLNLAQQYKTSHFENAHPFQRLESSAHVVQLRSPLSMCKVAEVDLIRS